MQPITLKTNERVFTTGKTGSGKTFINRYLTAKCTRLLVFDGKGTLEDWGLHPWDNESKQALQNGDPIRARITVPFGDNIVDYWDSVMWDVYRAGNVTVYIDELYTIAPPQARISNVLWALYTRGRELGIGVWSSTQRPVWIPMFALSESEHFFCFRLQLEDDRKRMSEFMGSQILSPVNDEHGFYYSRAEWNAPEYYKQLEVSEAKKNDTITIEPETIPEEKMQNLRIGHGRGLRRLQRRRSVNLSQLWTNRDLSV